MSGFDWKLPADIQADKDKEKAEYIEAITDPKHPKHKWAKEKYQENKRKNIEFWKKRRAKYYTKDSGSAIDKILNKNNEKV